MSDPLPTEDVVTMTVPRELALEMFAEALLPVARRPWRRLSIDGHQLDGEDAAWRVVSVHTEDDRARVKLRRWWR